MEHGKQGMGLQLLRVQDLPNVRMRDAVMRAVRSLKARPEPRWQWDNVASNRSAPWRPLVKMLHDAIAAGAPIDDVLAPVQELEGLIRARYAQTAADSLPALLVDEARADAAADVAQAEAAAVPSRPAIERVIETSERQISKATALCTACRNILMAPVRFGRMVVR